jgi:hypothetical protein
MKANRQKPTPWEVAHAADTLRAAGFVLVVHAALQLLTVEEAGRVLKVHVKWIKSHASEFPGLVRLPGGHLRIPTADVRGFLARSRDQKAQGGKIVITTSPESV